MDGVNDAPVGGSILGSLHSVDGTALVRLENRFDATIDELWSALTDPLRLVRWLGDVEGDLRPGGEFRARYFASGWEGTVRVDACQPPRRLLLHTKSAEEPDAVIEARLTDDGEQTILTVEDRGLPLEHIAAYGAGDQIHLEDLAAYLAGGERRDARARFAVLHPAYQRLAAELT